MSLHRRSYFLRLCAAVLVGSFGVGLASPVLAFGRFADRLSVNGIGQEALDAALSAASESATPAALAQAVTSALGESAPPPEVFLQALYGHLYQLLNFQQGPEAVTMASATAHESANETSSGIPVEVVSLRALGLASERGEAIEDVACPLPRDQYPAVQPLGP